MHQRAVTAQVHQLKEQLQEIETKLEGEALPLPLLEEFKDAVDHVRNALWTAISSKDANAIGSSIVNLRLRRAREMCRQIVMDIDAHEITIESPELSKFRDALVTAQQRVQKLYSTGM